MMHYEEPVICVEKCEIEDVITTSSETNPGDITTPATPEEW